MRLAKIWIDVDADTAAFDKKLKEIERRLKGTGRSRTSAGFPLDAGFKELASSARTADKHLRKLAETVLPASRAATSFRQKLATSTRAASTFQHSIARLADPIQSFRSAVVSGTQAFRSLQRVVRAAADRLRRGYAAGAGGLGVAPRRRGTARPAPASTTLSAFVRTARSAQTALNRATRSLTAFRSAVSRGTRALSAFRRTQARGSRAASSLSRLARSAAQASAALRGAAKVAKGAGAGRAGGAGGGTRRPRRPGAGAGGPPPRRPGAGAGGRRPSGGRGPTPWTPFGPRSGRNMLGRNLFMGGSLAEFGIGALQIGAGMIGARAGLAVLSAPARVLEATADFQQRAKGVEVLLRASGETTEAIQATEQAMRRLGRTTVYSATDAATNLEYLVRVGYSSSEATNVLKAAMDGAAASGTDLSTTVELLSKVMKAFQVSTVESRHVSDILTQAANTTSLEMEELGEALKYVGVSAKQIGISMEDTIAAIAAATEQGLDAAQMGRGLRGVFAQLARPTVQKAFEDIGVRLTTVSGGLRSLTDIMRDFNASTRRQEGLERIGFLLNQLDREAGTAFAAIAQGVPIMERVRGSLTGTEGIASQQAEERLNTLGNQFALLRHALQSFGITLGETATGPLVAFMRGLRNAITLADSFIARLGKLPGGAKGVGGDVLAGIVGGGVAAAGLKVAGAAVGGAAAGGFVAFIRNIGLAVKHISAFSLAVVGATAALTALLSDYSRSKAKAESEYRKGAGTNVVLDFMRETRDLKPRQKLAAIEEVLKSLENADVLPEIIDALIKQRDYLLAEVGREPAPFPFEEKSKELFNAVRDIFDPTGKEIDELRESFARLDAQLNDLVAAMPHVGEQAKTVSDALKEALERDIQQIQEKANAEQLAEERDEAARKYAAEQEKKAADEIMAQFDKSVYLATGGKKAFYELPAAQRVELLEQLRRETRGANETLTARLEAEIESTKKQQAKEEALPNALERLMELTDPNVARINELNAELDDLWATIKKSPISKADKEEAERLIGTVREKGVKEIKGETGPRLAPIGEKMGAPEYWQRIQDALTGRQDYDKTAVKQRDEIVEWLRKLIDAVGGREPGEPGPPSIELPVKAISGIEETAKRWESTIKSGVESIRETGLLPEARKKEREEREARYAKAKEAARSIVQEGIIMEQRSRARRPELSGEAKQQIVRSMSASIGKRTQEVEQKLKDFDRANLSYLDASSWVKPVLSWFKTAPQPEGGAPQGGRRRVHPPPGQGQPPPQAPSGRPAPGAPVPQPRPGVPSPGRPGRGLGPRVASPSPPGTPPRTGPPFGGGIGANVSATESGKPVAVVVANVRELASQISGGLADPLMDIDQRARVGRG